MRRKTLRILLAGIAISCGCIAQAQGKPDAQAIVGAMVAQYKSASSYQDSGATNLIQPPSKIATRIENTSFQGLALSGETLVTFRTYYFRPSIFRFDWKSAFTGSREASIWSDGKTIYKWMPSRGDPHDRFTLFNSKYITTTVDEATGSSAGAAFPLVSMLVADASVVSFADLLNMSHSLTLINEEPVEGEMCYVISASLSGAPWTLWIDKRRHLLRKTRTVYSYGSFHERVKKGVRHEFFAEEIHRDIKLNEPISKDVFGYRPKLESRDTDLTH